MNKLSKGKKWGIVCMISLSMLSFSLLPTKVYAMADAGVVAVLTQIFKWAKGEMLDRVKQIEQSQTDQLKNKADDIFKQKTRWEKWPSSLRSLFVADAVKLENQGNKVTYDNTQSFLNYTQGKAGGIDASKQPLKRVHYFNYKYDEVQKMSPSCQLDVPQPIGDETNKCSPAQKLFTNYMITGVHPMPTYPKDATENAVGQQYQLEKKEYETRTALAHLALDKISSKSTNDFINRMQKSLQNPTPDTINNESSVAVARDALILQQERAIIQLKEYESSLMNQRLLATIVAQNEEIHLKRIHELARNIH